MMRKPKVVILGTGGTIAGKAGSNTEMTGYQAGEIGIQTLINAVPEMLEVADVTGEQFCNIGSFDMIDDIWLRLSRRVSELLQQPEVDGIVITHGTDTLEETAYFLNLTVKSEKPVVLVGAMRPATAMSADGPVNLLNAVALAGSQEAVGKGVLIAMNDQINGARDATKTNTTHVETFKSWELGYLGYFQNGKPIFYKASLRRHTAAAEFDISKVTALPRVDIVYLHVNCDDILVRAAVSAGALGIVIAAFGHGNLHINIKPALIKIARSGIPVVRSTRVGNGIVSRSANDTDNKFIAADSLNPQKARILLQLALLRTKSPEEIQRMFDEYCEWLFNILFEVENRTDISNYDSYNKRLYGFLSERLINIWVMQQNLKVKEYPVQMTGISILTRVKNKFFRKN